MPYTDKRVTCQPWITDAQLCCAGGDDTTDCNGVVTPLVYPWTDAQYIQAASDLLYARTCYRYPGVCTFEAYPCLGGSCCSRDDCSCCVNYPFITVPTEMPLLAVNSITIDGVPFVDFRVDKDKKIVRTDGECWPACNTLGLPTPNGGADVVELIVNYDTGRNPPIALQMAAADLVCELKKACNESDTCALPAHVKNIKRRGVEVEVQDITSLLMEGLTGIPSVDHAIAVYGKCPKQRAYDPAHPTTGLRVG